MQPQPRRHISSRLLDPHRLRCIPNIAVYAIILTAQENILKASEDTTSRIARDLFLDNFTSDVDSVDEGKPVIKKIFLLLKSVGYTMTK